MQSSTELELLRMVTDTREDFAKLLAVSDETRLKIIKIETHLEKLNGNVAKHSQGLTEAVAWQRAHAADHREVADEREERSRQRVEIFKAAPPYLTWALNVAVIVLLLTGVNVPAAVSRVVDTPLPMASPHPAPIVTPTATPEPRPTATPRPTVDPRPSAVPTAPFNQSDREHLARLCVVEVRSMAEKRADACLSVISTVMTRIAAGQMTDGTIAGTITRGCTPESVTCQFPAYVINGCEGIIATACPHNYPDEIAYFLRVVSRYFDDGERGSCTGYLFYWLLKAQDCRIESEAGTFTNWYRKAEQ